MWGMFFLISFYFTVVSNLSMKVPIHLEISLALFSVKRKRDNQL